MSYTLQQIYEALGKVENGGAMVADLQDAISVARNEAAASRVAKNKVLDALGLRGEDNDDALKNLSETLKALRQAGNPETLGSQIASMQSQIKELTEKYAASETKAKAEREKRLAAARTAAVQAALAKGNALNPESMVKLVADNIVAKDDDRLIFRDGDKELSVEEGIRGWLAANPWAVKNTASGGAGSGGGKTGGSAYTMEDLKAMTADEINAHWDDISKMKG